MLSKSWHQWSIFCGMYVNYMFTVANRKAFAFVIPSVIKNEGLDGNSIGITLSSIAMGYTIGKFVFGILIDRFSPRYMFVSGLFLSGLFNIIFSIADPKWFSLLYFLTGLAQGPAWPACIKLLRRWYSLTVFGTLWSALATSINVTSSLGPMACSLLVEYYGTSWRSVMMLGGIASCMFALLSLIIIKDSPEDVGFPATSDEVADDKNIQDDASSKAPRPRRSPLTRIVLSPYTYVISLAYLVSQMTKDMLADWGSLYLMQEKDATQYFASSFMGFMETGGIIGSIFSGYFSDMLVDRLGISLKGHPRHILLIPVYVFLWICMDTLRVYVVNVNDNKMLVLALGFSIGFTVYTVINLAGVLVIENTSSDISGTTYSVCALFGNLGSTLAGLPFSMLMESFAWDGALLVYEACIACSIFMFCMSQCFSCYIGRPKKHDKVL